MHSAHPHGSAGNPSSSDELQQLKVQLLEMQKQRDEYLNSLQRERADFLNFRKRTEEEKKEFVTIGQAYMLAKWIPLYEHLQRAAGHLPDDLKDHEWVKGVMQIEALFEKLAGELEVERFVSIGQKFDSSRHEAMLEVPGEKGLVVNEFESGYMFRGKVIKPAKVAVGNGQKEGGMPKPPDANAPQKI